VDHGISTSWIVSAILLAGVASTWGCSFAPDINKVGGFVLVYELDETNSTDDSTIVEVVEQRLASRRGVRVRLIDGTKLEVTVPGLKSTDLHTVQDLITTAGVLDFRIVAEISKDSNLVAIHEESSDRQTATELLYQDQRIGLWLAVKQKADGQDMCDFDSNVNLLREGDGQREVLIKTSTHDVNGSHLRSVSRGFDDAMKPAINFSLTTRGAQRMRSLTRAYVARRLAIIVDGRVISAPTIQSEISDRGQITGQFAEQEVEFLVRMLRAGPLPYKVKDTPLQVREVSAGAGS